VVPIGTNGEMTNIIENVFKMLFRASFCPLKVVCLKCVKEKRNCNKPYKEELLKVIRPIDGCKKEGPLSVFCFVFGVET